MKRSGFTLVELLVVIAIIGVLAGLLLPVLSNAKTAADKTTGINNMKQIVLAEKLYQDREGAYPPYDGDAFIGFLYYTNDVSDLKVFKPKGASTASLLNTNTAAACTTSGCLPGLCGYRNATTNVSEPTSASSCAMAADSKDNTGAPLYKGARVVGYFDGSARSQGPPTINIGSTNGSVDTEKDLIMLQIN